MQSHDVVFKHTPFDQLENLENLLVITAFVQHDTGSSGKY